MQVPETYISQQAFEQLYIRLREKEGRIYTDEQVAKLPYLDKVHPHYAEWQTRANSLKRLMNYLKGKNRTLSILEVGCGNGWLTAQLAANIPGEAFGTDINSLELEQAKRVFYPLHNLHFFKADIRKYDFENKKFDIIVFAAAVQYFSSLDEIIAAAKHLLNKNGEIHLIDSMFYADPELAHAKKGARLTTALWAMRVWRIFIFTIQ